MAAKPPDEQPRAAALSRRGFATACTGAAVAAAAAGLGGCAAGQLDAGEDDAPLPVGGVPVSAAAPVEYVVIGSGAGGGPLAANLARAGHKVVLLEAGGADDGPDYAVPAFHPLATEDPALSWAYYVRHYADQRQQVRDSKFVTGENGVLYPRAGTLGGCTAHHAMITVTADAADWDGIAALTGDASWRAENMRGYFQRLERCQYRGTARDPFDAGSRHGYRGWLTTRINSPLLLARDAQLKEVVFGGVLGAGLPSFFESLLASGLDPNDWRAERDGRSGVYNVPVSIQGRRRAGTREYVQQTARALPNNLLIQTHALASRIVFEGDRAVAVEYLEGAHLYRADPRAPRSGPEPGPRRRLRVTREVILAAGAFNSPQLLKLSGIGPRDELARFGIPCLIDLPGVGRNLQDRYEATVVTRMRAEFALLRACGFRAPGEGQPADPCYAEWLRGGGDGGVYATNGTVLGVVRRSAPERPSADLFVFGVPGCFRGYYPGYSRAIRDKDFFTWAVLKAHTRNAAGTVSLRSADPRDMPEINFRYFAEGDDARGEDLASVVAGIAFARRMNAPLYRPGGPAAEEVVPGTAVASPDAVARFVADEAWGHHASCTNRIGPAGDRMAVVDSRFRVHGTRGLRVVDASVFPRIPGFFIITPIYVISEKASDAILADARVYA